VIRIGPGLHLVGQSALAKAELRRKG
jgi:hypothetical protein